MDVLIMQVFVSLLLVVGSVVLLAYSVKHADHEHADRLSLLPLELDGQQVGDPRDEQAPATLKTPRP